MTADESVKDTKSKEALYVWELEVRPERGFGRRAGRLNDRLEELESEEDFQAWGSRRTGLPEREGSVRERE